MSKLPPRPKLPKMPRPVSKAPTAKEGIDSLTSTLEDAFWEEQEILTKFGEPTWKPKAGLTHEPITAPKPAPTPKPVMPSLTELRREGGLPQILTLTPRDRNILTMIGANRRMNLNQIAEAVTASQNRPYEDVARVAEGLRRGAIQKLKDLGLIKRITPGKYAASSPFFILTEEAVSAYPAAVWAGEPELLADDFTIAELDLIDHSYREAVTSSAISLGAGNMLIKHWDPRTRRLVETVGPKYFIIPAHRIAMAKKDMSNKGIGTYEVQKKAMRAWLASDFPAQSMRDWDFFAPLPEQTRSAIEHGLVKNFQVDEHVFTPPAFLFASLDGGHDDLELLSFAIARPNITDGTAVYNGSAAARFDADLSESKEEKKMILWRMFSSQTQFSQLLWITSQPEIETRVWEAWLSLISEGRVKQTDIGWLSFGYYQHQGK